MNNAITKILMKVVINQYLHLFPKLTYSKIFNTDVLKNFGLHDNG